MKNIPSFEDFLNESSTVFKSQVIENYDITADTEILINSNLNQDILNNIAKGGDAASLIKKKIVAMLKKRTGGVGELAITIGNSHQDNAFVSSYKKFVDGFSGFKTWWQFGGRADTGGYGSCGNINIATNSKGKMCIAINVGNDPNEDKHLADLIIIKQK